MMEWISVNDRLPEEEVKVLTFHKKKGFHIDYMIFLGKLQNNPLWACVLEEEYNLVSHWMPLPEPPHE